MNNLYEFGGSCDVIIRCNSERTIGGKTYATGEPYTILQDVFVQLGYVNTGSESNAKKNILSSRIGLPDTISIMNIVLTDKICDLVTTRISPKTICKSYLGISNNNTIFLPESAANDIIYIYKNNERIEDYKLSEFKDFITSSMFEEDEEYLVFYNVLSSDNCFDFTTPHYGYFSIDVWAKGNENKQSKDLYITIPACSLVTNGMFNLVRGDILNAPLVFNCIHQNQEMPYFSID